MPEFDSSRCYVRAVSYQTAAVVIAEAHYIGTPGSTSVSLGLYIDDVIAGVLTYGTIPGNNATAVCGPDHKLAVMELTRLALYDWAPRNSESWFIAQTFRWMECNRPDVSILLSYADSSVGHVGTIYQATNWIYTGASTNDMVYQMDNGDVIHARSAHRKPLPPGKWMPVPAKHRYVNFLGGPAARRRMRGSLRWDALPYPKQATESAVAA
jgi:hypothetical protein